MGTINPHEHCIACSMLQTQIHFLLHIYVLMMINDGYWPILHSTSTSQNLVFIYIYPETSSCQQPLRSRPPSHLGSAAHRVSVSILQSSVLVGSKVTQHSNTHVVFSRKQILTSAIMSLGMTPQASHTNLRGILPISAPLRD